jgi:ADP-L-glycero-D-manno-heptose 6-epimerase
MIIVTGGAGLIGSAVVWLLNQRGTDDIFVVDHLGCGEKWKNLVSLSFSDYLEKDDFLRRISSAMRFWPLPGKREDVEAIIHLGACSTTTEQDASYLINNNFEYSKQLALFALQHGVRFIYASSAATYGDGGEGFSDDAGKLHRLRPLNMYGYSKHLFDLWAQTNGLLAHFSGLKYFNVFGPNEYHKGEMRSLVLKAYEQILSTGRLCLFRSHRKEYVDGGQQRDFLYVKDAALMTLHVLENRLAGLYNIGSGRTVTWNELATAIFRAMDRPEQIEYIDMPGAIREKYQYYTCADMERLRISGFDESLTPLSDAVDDYVKNYLRNHGRLGE